MSSSYKITTPPTVEPITLSDVKNYLRVDFTDEDSVIQDIITRARAYAEAVTHRALATQSIQVVYMIDRPSGGELYGPIQEGPNWYQYQEQLGANPFGAAMFYFDLPLPPIQQSAGVTVQTKVTVWDDWETFTGLTYIDDTVEPARMYFQVPVTANMWMFQYTCGYSNSYPLPPDLRQCLMELCAFWYENREAQDVPQATLNKLLARRVDWL